MSLVSPRSMIVQFCSMMSICMFIVIISFCVILLCKFFFLTLLISIRWVCSVNRGVWVFLVGWCCWCACGVLLARGSLYVKRCCLIVLFLLIYFCVLFVVVVFLNCWYSFFNCGVSGLVLMFICFVLVCCCLIVRGFG